MSRPNLRLFALEIRQRLGARVVVTEDKPALLGGTVVRPIASYR